MSITVEINKNAGGWTDYSDYIVPGIIREEIEENLTEFRCGDVTCEFHNFDDTFFNDVPNGLFDGWQASDVFEIRIKKNSDLHFGGEIDVKSLSYNEKTEQGEFTAFSYGKALERYSAEGVQRSAATFTLAADADEGDSYIEVSEAITALKKNDVLRIYTTLLMPQRSEEKTVKYLDTTNKKIYFTEDIENDYDTGYDVFVELMSRQYREKDIDWLAEQVAGEAGYSGANVDVDMPSSFDTTYLNVHETVADGLVGTVRSIVGRATGGDEPDIVTDDGTYEGEFGGLWTKSPPGNSESRYQIDFINEGYFAPTSFTKRLRAIASKVPKYAYSYNLDKRWWTEQSDTTVTVKSQDWNNGTEQWQNEQTIGNFTGYSDRCSYDRNNGFVYVGTGTGATSDRVYYVRLSDTSIQYFTVTTDAYVPMKYLYFADRLVTWSLYHGKARVYQYSGGSLNYNDEFDIPKGLFPETLFSVTDAGHTEFNKIFALCRAGEIGSQALYLWYCDHNFTDALYEFITDEYTTYEKALTYENGALYVGLTLGTGKHLFFKLTKTRNLQIADANFANKTVAQTEKELAIAGRAIFHVTHAGVFTFYDRTTYIDGSGTNITSLLDEQKSRYWNKRVDGVRVKWAEGDAVYPQGAKGDLESIDCELIDTVSFAMDTAWYYYMLLRGIIRCAEVELPLQNLQLLNWVVVSGVNYIIYKLWKNLQEEKMGLTLKQKVASPYPPEE